jgi:hypothetical protein
MNVSAVSKIAASEPSQPLGVLNYRCYLRDETGRFADTKIFGARDDNDAAALAFALFIRASSVYDRFEVWTKDSLVHAYRR